MHRLVVNCKRQHTLPTQKCMPSYFIPAADLERELRCKLTRASANFLKAAGVDYMLAVAEKVSSTGQNDFAILPRSRLVGVDLGLFCRKRKMVKLRQVNSMCVA